MRKLILILGFLASSASMAQFQEPPPCDDYNPDCEQVCSGEARDEADETRPVEGDPCEENGEDDGGGYEIDQ